MSPGALEGVRVLDLTHHIAGPYCTKLLADFGADVIKVERPEGDPARRMPPFWDPPTPPMEEEIPPNPLFQATDPRLQATVRSPKPGARSLRGGGGDLERSLLFLYLNTNKRGVTLNLKSTHGREMLKELAWDADILVENFSPRVMPSLGLDYTTLRALNPALVMVSISNFGQTGPYRDYLATEIVEYALGGLMYIFGAYDREPLKHALHQAQFKAGANAATAALIALYHQRATGQGQPFLGKGQHVDVSIQESMASALRDVVSNYTYTGGVRRRQPNHSGDLTRLRAVFDGFVVPNPGVSSRVDMGEMADFLDAPELKDEKFQDPTGRLANAEELGQVLDRHFGSRKKWETFYAAHQHRFIYGVVQSPEEVLANPQYASRGYFVDIDHPVVGTVKYPGAPFLMSGTPWQTRQPAPTLGQHNREILGQRFGHSDADLVQLHALGVI